jgi:hypothetical protein
MCPVLACGRDITSQVKADQAMRTSLAQAIYFNLKTIVGR